MAINVTGNIANIAVNSTSNVVTVSSSPVNVQLSATSVVSNTSVRQAINVSNLSGYGNLTYDSSNTSNGIIQYTGTANSDITTVIVDNPSAVRPALSASSPITYSSVTGVIGLEQTLDDLTLKKYQETIVEHGNDGGNISLLVDSGTIHKFTVTSDITKIDFSGISTGGSVTLILTQDGVGNNVLDTTTYPLEWVNWDFVNDFKSLDLTAGNYSILNVLYDGTKYYASLVVDSEISPTSLTVSGNIVGGNIDSQGVITSTGDITSGANINAVSYTGDGSQLTGIDSNADVKTYIEANGLDATANLTTTASLKSTGALGLVVTGNATIGGNLDVTGNINSETVVDLFVEDRNITMQYGATGTPSANSQIFIDRGDESNTYIKWDEGSDAWKFSNDGTVEYEFFTYDGSNITAGNANIDTSVNIGENSGANATLTLHANTSTTVYPNVELYAPGMARMAAQPTAYTTRLSPGGLSVNGLGVDAVTPTTNNFTVDLTELDFYAGNITGTNPIQVRVEDDSDFTLNPSTDLSRGKLRINKQGAGSIATQFTDIVTHEDLQLFDVPFGGQVQLNDGALLGTNKSLSGGTSGTNSIDVSGQIRSTDKIYTDGGGNIESAGYLVGGSGIVTLNNITGGTLTATGNIDGANINANYFHGDGSNLTGIAGDISSVTAGAGLTGGGTSGAVTLDVGAGTGITVNADDIAVNMGDFTTSDLAEGTNLYFTTSAARAVLSTATQSASGGGALSYDSGTGVFNFTPADSVTTATNATQVAITDDTSTDAAHYVTLSPAASGNQALEVSSSKLSFNPSSGVLQTDHISSDSAQPLQLKGQTDGIKIDKTIATVESRIFDTDTTGYSLADADLGTANVTTASIPRILTAFYGTAGQSTLTCVGLAASSGIYTAFELAGGAFTYPNAYWNPNAGGLGASAQTSLEDAMGRSGTTLGGVAWAGLGNLSGWRIYDVTNFSSTYLMGVTGHITGISGNTVTLSEPLLNNVAGAVILIPGAFSSTQNFGMVMTGDTSTNALTFDYALSLYNQYDLPETLSNVTVDRIAYGSDSTINLANVVMRHIADVETGPDSAIKVPRSMLIGANVTPDLLSIGTNEALAATSTLGITIEQDGVTDFGPLETTPQMKLMLNNYKTNSLASYTEYPKWTEFLGQSGNATVDMPYLGAPNLNFKLIGGTKPAKAATTGGDIVGRITYNALSGSNATGSDQFNPPASITAMVGGTGDLSTMANLDMYFQSTSATSYRNGPYVSTASQGDPSGGSIPQTFLASKSGTTVLAANQAGTISLRPVRDYADSGDASSYIDNRYADNLHEYHTFLDVGYDNPAGRTGSQLTINAKSGQTNGATPSGSDFNYDSKGNATLSFQTHNSDSSARYNFDLIHDEASEKFFIESGLSNQQHIEIESAGRVSMKQVMRLHNLTTAEINALSGPLQGDTVFNTTLNLVCVYDGSSWQKINSSAMGT